MMGLPRPCFCSPRRLRVTPATPTLRAFAERIGGVGQLVEKHGASVLRRVEQLDYQVVTMPPPVVR
jgi:hypothetical protein